MHIDARQKRRNAMVYVVAPNEHDEVWWAYHATILTGIPLLVTVINDKEYLRKVRDVVVDTVKKTVTFKCLDVGYDAAVESNWDTEEWHIFESREVVP